MGYTIGSGKDSVQTPGQTEQDFLARFQARQPEIVAYKKQHGGALEDAYQAVVGEPWPTGRSVKVHGDGRAELTKDRTTKSVLGKYVALPAAMAAGGYFAAPAIAGMLAGGAGAAGGGAAAGGSLIGAGGAASGVGAGLTGLGAAGGVSSGLLGGLGTAAGLGTAGTTAASGGGLLGSLGTASKLAGLGEQLTAGAGANAEGRRSDTLMNNAAAGQNNRALADVGAFNLGAPAARASQVMRGDVMGTMRDAAPTGDPRIDKFGGGGLRPSAFGPATAQAGDALKKQALLALMKQSDTLTPQMAQPQQAGLGENVMAGVGMGANVLSGLSAAGKLGKYGRMFT